MAWKLLNSNDTFEQALIIEITRQAAKVTGQIHKNLAIMIAGEVSKLFKK